jgi:hypothetical protein
MKKLENLINIQVPEKETEALQKRLARHKDELFTFLDYPHIVEPTNNHAERQLRPVVIMRKITFGNKTTSGEEAYSVIISLLQTAKLNGKRPFDVLLQLFSNKNGLTLFDLTGFREGGNLPHSCQLLLPYPRDPS